MDGYSKSTELSSSVGLSERRIKEIARNANISYLAVKPEHEDGFYWLPTNETIKAIKDACKKSTDNRRRGAARAAATRANNRGSSAGKKKRAAQS